MSVDNFYLPDNYGKDTPKKELSLPINSNGLVLHYCCAPCCTALVECLLYHHIKPLLFFFNPNIYPETEYQKRLHEWIRFCDLLELKYVIGDYDHVNWLKKIKGLEKEPERGGRCLQCFTVRLEATALLALSLNINTFTTTLGTSRWKCKPQIDAAGQAVEKKYSKICYWDQDWRKGGLITRRNELVKEINFYNQKYCGCEFSMSRLKMTKLHIAHDI